MAYEIKKGFPIGNSLVGATTKYPYREMEVGDCFDVPVEDANSKTVAVSASAMNTTLAPKRFKASRTEVPGHTRVQRIA